MSAITPEEVQALAAARGITAQQIDPQVWQMDATDDMGDYFEQQDAVELEQRLAVGRLQAKGVK